MMLTRAYWLIRYGGFALIGITALINPPAGVHQELYRSIQIGCFAAAGVALLGWLLVDLYPRYRRRGLPAALVLLAAASGLAGVTSGGGQSLVAFAAGAAVAAGFETDWPEAIAVAAAGMLPIWIAGPVFGASLGTLAGYPLLIAATLSFGRNRRFYRIQAEQAAALVEQYERARAEQRRADVLDERARIAREIHDVLAHSLGALGIQIQAAKAVLTDTGDVGRAVEVLSTAQRMAADGLTETRRAVHALRVDSLPLADELAAVVETHRQRYQVPVTFASAGAARVLPPDASLALLRAAQEALVNAAKHAAGEPIAVRLDYGQADVRLRVVNELGPGADPGDADGLTAEGPSSAGGYGLTGMRERLRLLNGTLEAGAGDGEWAVTAELPLASSDMNGGYPAATTVPRAAPSAASPSSPASGASAGSPSSPASPGAAGSPSSPASPGAAER